MLLLACKLHFIHRLHHHREEWGVDVQLYIQPGIRDMALVTVWGGLETSAATCVMLQGLGCLCRIPSCGLGRSRKGGSAAVSSAMALGRWGKEGFSLGWRYLADFNAHIAASAVHGVGMKMVKLDWGAHGCCHSSPSASFIYSLQNASFEHTSYWKSSLSRCSNCSS